MALKDQIQGDLKAAMRAGDETRKTALRQLLASIKQAELEKRQAVAKRQSSGADRTEAQVAELEQVTLDDAELIGAIQREAKARRETIADAQKAGRPDLMAGAEAELAYIAAYLPRQLSRDEIVALARAAIEETGAQGPKDVNNVMRVLSPRVKGQADGRTVSEIVRELLAT